MRALLEGLVVGIVAGFIAGAISAAWAYTPEIEKRDRQIDSFRDTMRELM